jgi:L-malate glycosyltransferase
VVPSGFLKVVFARFGIEAAIVPNVVDLRRFSPAAAGESAPAEPHLVVTRNLEPVYDNATALRAFAIVWQRHPSARLTVAGSGPERAALEALAAELGIAGQVRFAGRLDRAEMADLYRRATLMLNPSRTDNTPNSVLEAWACAVPVVSTRVGGVPYLVDDGRTGILVPPQDPQALADAALAVIEQPALRASLAQAGQREAQRYTWEQVRPQLLATYRRVLPPATAARLA